MATHVLIESKKILNRKERRQYRTLFAKHAGDIRIALIAPKRFPSDAAADDTFRRFDTLSDYGRWLSRQNQDPLHLMRLRTWGHPLTADLIAKVSACHRRNGYAYTLADGARVMLYEWSLEMADLPPAWAAGLQTYPDGTLVPPPGPCHNYHPDRADMAHFLSTHFDQLYGLPRNIMLEVSTACNLRCKMCFYFAPRNGSGLFDSPMQFMALDEFKRRLDRIGDAFGNYPNIDFNGRGEPLMNRHLPQMIAYAKTKGFYCSLSTNGHFLDTDLSHRLIDAGLDVLAVSIDAADKATYGRIRLGGDYERLLNNIDRFLDLRARQGTPKPELLVKMILQPENSTQQAPFVDQWRHKADRIAVWGECVPETSGNANCFEAAPFGGFDACVSPWGNCMLSLEGNLYPCCLVCTPRAYHSPLAHMDALDRFWHSETLDAYRTQILAGKGHLVPFCGRCRYRSIPTALERRYADGLFIKTFYNMIGYSRI